MCVLDVRLSLHSMPQVLSIRDISNWVGRDGPPHRDLGQHALRMCGLPVRLLAARPRTALESLRLRPGSMVYAWAAAFSFGFYFLPLLSKAIWSRPQLLLLLSRIEASHGLLLAASPLDVVRSEWLNALFQDVSGTSYHP